RVRHQGQLPRPEPEPRAPVLAMIPAPTLVCKASGDGMRRAATELAALRPHESDWLLLRCPPRNDNRAETAWHRRALRLQSREMMPAWPVVASGPGALARGEVMDSEQAQAIAARDQFWSSLRALLPEIERLAAGQFGNSERQQQLVLLLARVVVAELQFRAEHAEPE